MQLTTGLRNSNAYFDFSCDCYKKIFDEYFARLVTITKFVHIIEDCIKVIID